MMAGSVVETDTSLAFTKAAVFQTVAIKIIYF
jgi:hypothetical protein